MVYFKFYYLRVSLRLIAFLFFQYNTLEIVTLQIPDLGDSSLELGGELPHPARVYVPVSDTDDAYLR